MMGNSGDARVNIPANLFGDDEEETPEVTTKQRPVRIVDDTPDDEFMKMVETTSKKMRRRELASKSKSKRKTIAASSFDRSLAEVDEMIKTGDWDGAKASHLVALYQRLHHRCYGMECADLGPSERYNAAMLASQMVKRHFGDDFVEAADFMKWAWEKEIRVEKWRRENQQLNGRRIGYRLMFGSVLVMDYRLFLARRSHKP